MALMMCTTRAQGPPSYGDSPAGEGDHRKAQATAMTRRWWGPGTGWPGRTAHRACQAGPVECEVMWLVTSRRPDRAGRSLPRSGAAPSWSRCGDCAQRISEADQGDTGGQGEQPFVDLGKKRNRHARESASGKDGRGPAGQDVGADECCPEQEAAGHVGEPQQFLFIAKHLRGETGGLIAGRSAGDQVPSHALALCLQTRIRLS